MLDLDPAAPQSGGPSAPVAPTAKPGPAPTATEWTEVVVVEQQQQVSEVWPLLLVILAVAILGWLILLGLRVFRRSRRRPQPTDQSSN